MRLIHTFPLVASLALAACGNSPEEELSGEALSAEEIADTIVDNGVMPQPGEYSTNMELISFDVPGASSINMDALLEQFEEGAASQSSFCVSEAMDRESLISAMTDNSCDITRLSAEGNDVNLAMTCQAEDGPQGRIAMSGTMTETSSNMEMEFNQPIPGIGEAMIAMRIVTEHTGDCS